MEDALVHTCHIYYLSKLLSLNPCFNGRCTRTRLNLLLLEETVTVLILVLMEDALVLQESVP